MDNFFEAEISCRFSQAIVAIYYRCFLSVLTAASALIARSSDISSFRHSRGNESCRVPSFKFNMIFPFKYRVAKGEKENKFGTFYRISKESFKRSDVSDLSQLIINHLMLVIRFCNKSCRFKIKSEFNR